MPDPDSSILFNIILLFVLILCNAFFAMSEIAVISLNDNKMKKMAEEGNKKARAICKLTKEPSKFLATIQVGVTLSGFFASAVAADSFVDKIMPLILSLIHISTDAPHHPALPEKPDSHSADLCGGRPAELQHGDHSSFVHACHL